MGLVHARPGAGGSRGRGRVGERNALSHQSGTLAHDIPDPARARPVTVSCVAAVEVVRGAYAACAENLALQRRLVEYTVTMTVPLYDAQLYRDGVRPPPLWVVLDAAVTHYRWDETAPVGWTSDETAPVGWTSDETAPVGWTSARSEGSLSAHDGAHSGIRTWAS